MATAHLVSVEEYMHSTFEPDAEYVEGRIVHRSMPQLPHSQMQTYLVATLYWLFRQQDRYRVYVAPRLRTTTTPARYRVPDVCVTIGKPEGNVITAPPFFCIEILSPDDSLSEHRTKIKEYLAMGVSYIWIVDPVSYDGEIHTQDGIERVRDGLFRAGDIEVDVRDA